VVIKSTTTTKMTRVEEIKETTEMGLNRGNVRCHFNKGGNIDAERNSKNRCCTLDQLKEGCTPLSTPNHSYGR
jgi:hypothetical protein